MEGAADHNPQLNTTSTHAGSETERVATTAVRLRSTMQPHVRNGSLLFQNETTRLSVRGKKTARGVYEKVVASGSTTSEVRATVKNIRVEITRDMAQVRKQIAFQLAEEWKQAGISKRVVGASEFTRQVRERYSEDLRVMEAQVERKLLSSVCQRAVASEQKEARDRIKAVITEADIASLKQELQQNGKKLPSDALLRNALVSRRLKEEREQQQQAPVQPAASEASVAPAITPVNAEPPAAPPTPEPTVSAVEAQTQRARKLTVRVRSRQEEIQKSMLDRLKLWGLQGEELLHGVGAVFKEARKRPALVAVTAAMAASALLAFSPPRPGLTESISQSVGSAVQRAIPTPTAGPKPPITTTYVVSETIVPPAVEKVKEEQYAKGTFVGAHEAFLPDSDQRILLASENVKILGYADKSRVRFKAEDPATKQIVEIPIAGLEVEGSVISKGEMPRREGFGIRNDWPELMDRVPELGASIVRISGGHGELLTTDSAAKEAIEAAKQNKLDIVYNLNPGRYISPEDTHRRLQQLFDTVGSYDKKIILELGNEPDDTVVPYWEKRDLKTFARWVAEATKEAKEMRPGIEVVVGALVNANLQESLVSLVESYGLSRADVTWAIHAYGMDEVATEIPKVRRVVGDNIMLTEVGLHEADKKDFSRMLDMAKSLGAKRMLVHELPQSVERYGLIDPYTKETLSGFYYLQSYALKSF